MNIADLERRLAAAKTDAEVQEIEALLNATQSQFEVRTLAEVAELLGLELQTVKQMRTGPNPMPGREKHWNMIDIFRWRCDRLQRSSAAGKPAEILELERRQLAADVEKRELAVQIARGDLVERSAVKSELLNVLNTVRTQIEAIPSEIGPSLPPELRSNIIHELQQQLRLILRKMSQARIGEGDRNGTN